jgi:hypothetical protein
MAIIRSVIPAVLAFSLSVFIPQVAFAKGPCDNQSAKQQIKFQKHQLDDQKRIVERQYRGPGNEFARRDALAQIQQQRYALDAQQRALKDQQKDCKADRKYYK